MQIETNESLMHAVFVSRLGRTAQVWKAGVEQASQDQVPKDTMQWILRLRKDFYPTEASTVKWWELVALRQNGRTMNWLVQQFNELRIQIDDKQDKDFVRQLGIAANAWGQFSGIGEKLLDEQVRRADTAEPLSYLQAVNLAERFASREIEVLRSEGKAIRGGPEPRAAQVNRVNEKVKEKPAEVKQVTGTTETESQPGQEDGHRWYRNGILISNVSNVEEIIRGQGHVTVRDQ
jgi:hypothetical protein